MSLQIQSPSGQAESHPADRAPAGYIFLGLAIVILLFGGLIAWSITAKISGAVIASGTVAVESKRKSVEHLDGGLVGAIFVQDGDRVEAGQVLLRLDDTIDRANSVILRGQLDELMARQARLEAELARNEIIAFPAVLLSRANRPEVADILQGQADLLAARSTARQGEHRLMEQRIANFRQQIKGFDAQNAAKGRQLSLIRKELEGVETLYKQGHAPITRLLALQRDAAEIESERAELTSGKASAANQIGEVELRMIQAEHDLREEVTAELRSIQTQIYSLTEQQVAAEERLKRIEIRAPQAGTVFASKVHTLGGVVEAGEVVMEIVPEGDDLILEAKVPVQDVDKVAAGQGSRVRLTAFDQQTTPEMTGKVETVSADSVYDDLRGTSFYLARIRLAEGELAKLEEELELVPGMPAEIFIQTGERPAIAYFVKPLIDNFTRAFRDG